MSQAKICIVTTRNIFDSPCLAKYQAIIDEPFDIIYWDRCRIEEDCEASEYFKFDGALPSDAGKLSKFGKYIGFFCFVNKVLAKRKYEHLLLFPTQVAWLVMGKLKGEYLGKYILDIQDYAGEYNLLIKKLTWDAVNHAGLCSITSPAYKTFLPEHPYVISHNLQPIDSDLIQAYRGRKREANHPIVLAFIGSIRFIPQQKKLIQCFKNDSRFQLRFIGSGSEQLADFCNENAVENVELIGRFERKDLAKFYMDTDIAINIYGNRDPYLDYALSNKLYSAAMMGMPILCSPDTYMAELSEKMGFGCSVSLDDLSTPDTVFTYYRSINWEQLCSACDAFMQSVYQDEAQYQKAVKVYLSKGEI